MNIDAVVLRPIALGDAEDLWLLCVEHARFEQTTVARVTVPEGLVEALFGPGRRLFCLVAEASHATCSDEAAGDPSRRLVGYATYALEFSTWSGEEFIHMDTLFVEESMRGRGVGAQLFNAVRTAAQHCGVPRLEWQTPTWNVDAQRFYERIGATGKSKIRYSLPLAEAGIDLDSSKDSAALASPHEPIAGSVPVSARSVRAALKTLTEAWGRSEVEAVVAAFAAKGRYNPSILSPATAENEETLVQTVKRMFAHDENSTSVIDEPLIAGAFATRRWTYTTHHHNGTVTEAKGVDVFEITADGVLLKDAYRRGLAP
jgi:GNAT superfamily N-acetyltransferase